MNVYSRRVGRLKRTLGLMSVLLATPALAESIDPELYTTSLAVGQSITIQRTVTVSAGTPSTQADVFFLVDTSASMAGVINSVKNNAQTILGGTSAYGDLAWGVGSYEDFARNGWGNRGDEPWRLNQGITTDLATAQAGLNSLELRSGADAMESSLYALTQAATTAGWREGSQKFVVWFGDTPGHDPRSTANYPGPTLIDTIDTLTGEAITVIAVNTGAANGGLNNRGQATAIADATGGNLTTLRSKSGEDILASILGSLDAAFAIYNQVTMEAFQSLPGVDISISPAYVGAWDRSEDRQFTFDITFTAREAGLHEFNLNALVDGGTIGSEFTRILVTADGTRSAIVIAAVPEPGILYLFLVGLGSLVMTRRKQSSR